MWSFWIECCVRALLMAAAVGGLLRLLRVRDAAAQHAAWAAVTAWMLLLPAMVAWGPKAGLRVLPARGEAAWVEAPAAPVYAAVTPRAASPRAARVRAAAAEPFWNPERMALALYMMGLAAMLAQLIAGTAGARRLVRTAQAEAGFLVSTHCAAPVTVGWWRPRVVLPERWRQWPAHDLSAVLAHERAHARRRDPMVEWVAALNRCVFWFHPLAWWLKRRLAELAEDACDTAAITQGHGRHEYAECLIGQARAVEQAGWRLRVWGAAIDGSSLARRVRRVLDGAASPALSRRRAVAAAYLCGAALLAFSSCKLERAEKPLPGQPTMNQLMHRDAEERARRAAETKAALDAARALTPAEAKELEAKLVAIPDDDATRQKLLGYYQYKPDFAARDRHILWLIEHEPLNQILAWPFVDSRPDDAVYPKGKALWLQHIAPPGAKAEMFVLAGRFVEPREPVLAEEILLRGQKAYPDDKRWTGHLGRLYSRWVVDPGADAAFAAYARERLAASKDPELLASVALHLASQRQAANRDALLVLAKSYSERAAELAPASWFVLSQRLNMQLMMLSDASTPAPESQMLRTAGKMQSDCYSDHADQAAAEARQVLDLARQHPEFRYRGDAIFEAKMTLGKLALHRGDRREAVKQMLSAGETEGAERLRYGYVPMELPRSLVDWGERSAVAEFLEKCAKVNVHGEQLAGWAKEIRRGVNPNLLPMVTGCGKEPC
jgi:Zn-dependent protease with chaperone function